MATITSICTKTDVSEDIPSPVPSSKVAEIHREDSGRIFYVCFHCGLSLDNIADTLTHISFHFNPLQSIKVDEGEVEDEDPLDFFVIKHEQYDDSQEVVQTDQLEELFIEHLYTMDGKPDVRMGGTSHNIRRQTSSLAMENVSTVRMRLIKDEGAKIKVSKSHSSNFQGSKAQEVEESVVQGLKLSRYNIQRSTVAPKIQESKVQGLQDQQRSKVSCTLCPQKLAGSVNLMQHIFLHYDLKPFSCPQCQTRFCRKGTLDEHLNRTHSLKVAYNFQCLFCNDDKAGNLPEFVTHTFNYHLDDGEIDHSNLNSKFTYDCRFCFKNFTQWRDLCEHFKIHKDDELPKIVSPNHSAQNDRSFSERAKSGLYPSESLYNCSACLKTLCGSFEARNHWIAEHKQTKKVELRKIVSKEDELADRALQNIMKEKKFQCYDCDEVAKSRLSFMKHRLKHFNIRPYPCTLCSKTFHLNSDVVRHQKLTHNISPNPNPSYVNRQCHFCKANFTEEIEFITHMFDDHLYEKFNGDKFLDNKCQYECVYCKEMFARHDLMIKHLTIHENEETPVTDAEPDTTSPEATMNALRHKVEYMFCCLDCPEKFRLPYMASEHQKIKHKIEYDDRRKKSKESKTCDVCDASFHTWRSMVNHRGKVHPETNNPEGWHNKKKNKTDEKKKSPATRDTNCGICNKSFPTWRSMLNHKANRHPETHKPDKYKYRPVSHCKTCGKSFRDRTYLNKHEKTHVQPRPFTCDICNKQYSLKVTLQTHMLTHSKQRNFVCELCGKAFISVSKLNLHNQIHENLTLKCDLCDKVFLTRNNFSKHKKTHENRTRKECKICDKTFKSALSLRIHTLLHTGEKKYSCRYCSMSFAQSSGRRGHERTKHEKVD